MITKENIQHVLPVDDIMPHTEFCIFPKGGLPFCECMCTPEHQEVGDNDNGVTGLIVIHKSFDGREGVEWANEILQRPVCYKSGGMCKYNCQGLCKNAC